MGEGGGGGGVGGGGGEVSKSHDWNVYSIRAACTTPMGEGGEGGGGGK